MNYEYPLMEEERKSYYVIGDIDIDELMDSRPGAIVRCPPGSGVNAVTTLRQWWEPIEDEI